MKYLVHIANTAKSDIVKAADYIEFALKKPAATGRLFDKVEAVIKKLATFPCRNPIVDDTILAARGIRFIPGNNYMVFLFRFGRRSCRAHRPFLICQKQLDAYFKIIIPLNYPRL
ncbi:MAG: type II toxin-antitoxin system RelE/ParE family toxin [Phascolarctobacterium sp.]|nr:type II toxin-antitoxin system RelE/ParE family toxin [Phascolarctobacterium sp.]